MICSHNSIVFPGEIVPMILNAATLNCDNPSDGVKFVLVLGTSFPDNFFYGVTRQVFAGPGADLSSGCDNHVK